MGALYADGSFAQPVPPGIRKGAPAGQAAPGPERSEPETVEDQVPLPVLATASLETPAPSPFAAEPPVAPRTVERGVVVFDVDGTLFDDLAHISEVAADVLEKAFGTPAAEARIHYLATTGLPFEAQLAQLYPGVPPAERRRVAVTFHQRKAREAYGTAHPFAEVPKLLKRLAEERWTLVVSTGAEREIADLLLEREGIRYWFEGVLGAGQGTKREHLEEYRRRYPRAPIYLIGDSRFDMEVAQTAEGVVPLARATSLPGWTLSPKDLARWGAVWADYSLGGLVEVLAQLGRRPSGGAPGGRRANRGRPRRGRKGRDRDSP